MEKEFLVDDKILKIVNEIEALIRKDKYDDDSVGDFKQNFPDEIEN